MNVRVIILRSNPVQPDPRVEKIAVTLAKLNYQVKVIGWDRDGGYPKDDHRPGYNITRIRIKAQYGSGLYNLPALLLWQMALLMHLLLHHQQYDVLHACDFDTILPAYFCSKLFKKTLIYDIFDFYADHLRRTPALLKKVIKRLDFALINRVNAVILVDEKRQRQIEGTRPANIAFIYNTPADLYSELSKPKEDPGKPFTIVYVGLLQIERGLFFLVDLLKRKPDYHLDIAGFAGDSQQVQAAMRGVENIHFHGRIPYSEALVLSSQADLIWALYDPAIRNHQFASPNKLFEAMMLAKPILVAQDTSMDELVRSLDCGYIVNYGDVEQLEELVLTITMQLDLRQQKGKNGRQAYEESYSWSIMEERLAGLYQKVLADAQV